MTGYLGKEDRNGYLGVSRFCLLLLLLGLLPPDDPLNTQQLLRVSLPEPEQSSHNRRK